jgi:hypothetical protein
MDNLECEEAFFVALGSGDSSPLAHLESSVPGPALGL